MEAVYLKNTKLFKYLQHKRISLTGLTYLNKTTMIVIVWPYSRASEVRFLAVRFDLTCRIELASRQI